jgi:transketolase
VRNAFVRTLFELAANDPRIVLATGDIGFNLFESFAERNPAQFLNAGVADQNITGVAAGMALTGKMVFTYTIANFPTLRCLEQIRNDDSIHDANVKVVAVGGGMAYGSLGPTHHAVEDLGILRTLPNLTVVAPGDPIETELVTRAIAAIDGPCYLRLGKAGEPTVHREPPSFELGRAVRLRAGDDVTLISTGGTLAMTAEAAELLAGRGIEARVLSMITLAPFDDEAVLEAAEETRRIVTVEEHGVGGLASAVAEVLAGYDRPLAFRPLRLPRQVIKDVGSQEHLRSARGLSAENIARTAEELR